MSERSDEREGHRGERKRKNDARAAHRRVPTTASARRGGISRWSRSGVRRARRVRRWRSRTRAVETIRALPEGRAPGRSRGRARSRGASARDGRLGKMAFRRSASDGAGRAGLRVRGARAHLGVGVLGEARIEHGIGDLRWVGRTREGVGRSDDGRFEGRGVAASPDDGSNDRRQTGGGRASRVTSTSRRSGAHLVRELVGVTLVDGLGGEEEGGTVLGRHGAAEETEGRGSPRSVPRDTSTRFFRDEKKIARSGVARPARGNAIAVERDEHAGESSRDDSMDVADAHLQAKVVVGSEVVREVTAQEAVARLLPDGNSLLAARAGVGRVLSTSEIDVVAGNKIK